MADKPQPQDYTSTGETLLGGAEGAAKGAVAGAQVGAMTGTPHGILAGALIGGTVGFIGGAIAADKKQAASFKVALDSYKLSQDSAKLTKQVAKTEAREQKRQKGAAARSPDLPHVPQYDSTARDIMALSSRPNEEYLTRFDAFNKEKYGVG